MTVMAVNPQAGATLKTSSRGSAPQARHAPRGSRVTAGRSAGTGQPPAGALPSSARRRGFTPLTPMRSQTAKSMRRLADSMAAAHPGLGADQHVRDAARTLEAGNEEASQRHLRAAMFALTPQAEGQEVLM